MKELKNILLVDDNYAINLLHKKIISNLGVTAHIHSAKNGEEAIHFLHQAFAIGGAAHPKPDIIFMDINMPRMNAWEFLEEYCRRKYDTHGILFVLLTTSTNPDDEKRASTIPIVTEYMQKPLVSQKMLSLLEKHFDKWGS